jgi:hypothetical protein
MPAMPLSLMLLEATATGGIAAEPPRDTHPCHVMPLT